jgi:hypothetical protein
VAGVPLFTDGRLVKLMGALPPLHLTSVTYSSRGRRARHAAFAARRALGGLSLGARYAGRSCHVARLARGRGLWFAFGEPGSTTASSWC